MKKVRSRICRAGAVFMFTWAAGSFVVALFPLVAPGLSDRANATFWIGMAIYCHMVGTQMENWGKELEEKERP